MDMQRAQCNSQKQFWHPFYVVFPNFLFFEPYHYSPFSIADSI